MKDTLLLLLCAFVMGFCFRALTSEAQARPVYFRESDGGMSPKDWDGAWGVP
jgi:hypothetical protein